MPEASGRAAIGAGLLLSICLCAVAWATDPGTPPPRHAPAANAPVEPADADLLEFLGSVDSGADSQSANDGSWIEYLAQTDPGKVAKPPGGKPAPAQPPPPAVDKKNE